MVANIPDLVDARMTMSYHELFMYTLMWNVGLAAIAVTGIWIIMLLVRWKFMRKNEDATAAGKESVITAERSENEAAE